MGNQGSNQLSVLSCQSAVVGYPLPPAVFYLSHCYWLKSRFLAKISESTQRKSLKPKELYLAQRRRDAGFERPLLTCDLCASASLRALVLVAAEGHAGCLACLAVRWSLIPSCAPWPSWFRKLDSRPRSGRGQTLRGNGVSENPCDRCASPCPAIVYLRRSMSNRYPALWGFHLTQNFCCCTISKTLFR
jgi:hypothetical protein